MKCQTCQGKGYVNGEKCNCWYRSGEHSVHPCEDCHSTPTEKMIAIPKKGKISFRSQGKGYVNGEKCNCWYRSGEHSVHPCEDCHSTPTEKMIAIPKKGKISFRIKDGV